MSLASHFGDMSVDRYKFGQHMCRHEQGHSYLCGDMEPRYSFISNMKSFHHEACSSHDYTECTPGSLLLPLVL